MVTDKDIQKRLRHLESHPDAYIQSRQREFDEALESSHWWTNHIKKKFNKEIASKDIASGYGALLTARSRSPFVIYWAQSQIMKGNTDGWHLISMALENIWWAFKCRPSTYGDYESLIQLLLPWFYLAGQHENANSLGMYFNGATGIDGYEKYLENSSVGKFLANVWSWRESGSKKEHHSSDASKICDVYKALIDNLEVRDVEKINDLLVNAINFHIRSSSTEGGEFRTAYPFYLSPLEILYYIKVRNEKGFETEIPNHDIFKSPLSILNFDSSMVSPAKDKVLVRALHHAKDTGWILD